ncbi:hypothetical protein FC65_GL002242 [Ligilactobacillus acidipiscis DSM 15836]|uniref:Uncharacterized protein n=2 Tax=Ligilactobacillus acidipiscis TaxID=89059 RepID=A0A0R2KB78_9LACO|nr:hypothetical protein FC65_GL002242 [Ligilactobacillus acidipiscis DSM 15836]KRN84597.1 hypothetical protein IV43_GL001053 [Ligilactobacillus acidipiscis]
MIAILFPSFYVVFNLLSDTAVKNYCFPQKIAEMLQVNTSYSSIFPEKFGTNITKNWTCLCDTSQF